MAKLKNLRVTWISLVETPATGKGLTLKSADAAGRDFAIRKMDGDLMRAYGIVYAPDQVDSQGDSADADTIRVAANEFMRSGRTRNVDEDHGFDEAMAYVAESWLVRSGDPMFGDEPEGAWAVGIQVGDVDLWARLKSGDLTGLSLAGVAQREDEPQQVQTKAGDDAGMFAAFSRWLKTKQQGEDDEMTKEEIEALVKSTVTDAVTAAVGAAVGPAVEAAVKKSAADNSGGDDAGDSGESGGADAAIAKADLEAMEARLAQSQKDAIAAALSKGSNESESGAVDDDETFI